MKTITNLNNFNLLTVKDPTTDKNDYKRAMVVTSSGMVEVYPDTFEERELFSDNMVVD